MLGGIRKGALTFGEVHAGVFQVRLVVFAIADEQIVFFGPAHPVKERQPDDRVDGEEGGMAQESEHPSVPHFPGSLRVTDFPVDATVELVFLLDQHGFLASIFHAPCKQKTGGNGNRDRDQR